MNCEPLHERARRESEVFATFTSIGSMSLDDRELHLANCPHCHSTIGRVKPAPVPVTRGDS